MTQETVELKTPDGVMATRTFHPASGGPHPAVMMFQDGIGVRPALIEIASRIASNGYFVALPNLFYRAGAYAPFDGATVFRDPDERARLMGLIKEVTPERAASDTSVLFEWLKHAPAASTKKIGTVGCCMGGGVAIRASGAFPDSVAAAAAYHAGRLATDAPRQSASRPAAKAHGRLYVGYAENDESFPGGPTATARGRAHRGPRRALD